MTKAPPLSRALGNLVGDTGGAIAPMVAALGTSLLLAGGLALDVGLYRLGNRDLRAATEAAALAAAMNPAQAEARARDYLGRNGYDPGVLRQVTVGRYCADRDTAPAERFDPGFTRCPGAGSANAVRIRTAMPSRRFLTGILGSNVLIPDLAATATAARIDEAGVEISSGVLTVTNSLVSSVNNLLGALIGVQLRLSTTEIEALMGGNVDAGLFFDALARRTGHSGTYGELTSGEYSLRDIALSAAEAAGNAQVASALGAFATQVGSGYHVPLSGLFGFGVWENMPVGEADAPPALRAGINAYQLIAFVAQAGPGVIDASDAVNLLLPGNSAIVKIAAIASGPVSRPRFAFGPAGEVSVGTSALRLQLQLASIQLNVPTLLNQTISDLPLLVDVAAAQANVSAIACPDTGEQRRDTRVTVAASSGLVNAYLGAAPANAMSKPMPTITASDIGQAPLLSTTVFEGVASVNIKARAIAQPVLGQNASLVFGPGGSGTIGGPNAPGTPGRIGNGSQVGSTLTTLGTSLASGLSVDVRLLGLCLPIVCDLSAVQSLILGALLPAVTTPLGELVGTTADPLLDNILAALGIQLGHATVWVTGARCGVPVLV